MTISYETIKYLSLQNPIIEVGFAQGYLFAVDTTDTLYIFDNTYSLQLKEQITKNSKPHHPFSHRYSIAHGMISFGVAKTFYLGKFIDNKFIIDAKHPMYENKIVFTKFSLDGTLVFSAAEDGRARIITTATNTLRYILPHQPDYCSYAVFSKRSLFLFVGYFNNKNIILNLQTDALIIIETLEPIECALFFDNDTKLYLCDRSGNTITFDLLTDKEINKTSLINEWISCAIEIDKHIIIGTRKEKLYIVEPQTNTIAMQISLEHEGISSMAQRDGVLYLSFADGVVQVIDTSYKKDLFIEHIEKKEYQHAKDILDRNNFLYLNSAMELFNAGFEEVYASAKEFVTKGDIESAASLVAPFMGNKEFSHKIDLLFMQQEYIASFINATNKEEFESAYEIALRYPIIQTLALYSSLEKVWDRTFNAARNAIEEDPLRGKLRAKEILARYEKIPQKSELVKQLINNSEKFALAETFIKNQDFKSYFSLVGSYGFLKETHLYKKVDALANNIKTNALKAYTNKEYSQAKELFTQLLLFTTFHSFAKQHLLKIDASILLAQLIEQNDIKKIYIVVDKFPFLTFTDKFLKFNNSFELSIEEALKLSQSKQISKAIAILEPYISTPVLRKKLDNCLKLGYLKEIEEKELNEESIRRAIGRYKSLFGLDDAIEEIFTKKGLVDEFKYHTKANNTIDTKRYPESIFS